MKDSITFEQAIETTRESLLKAESVLFDKVSYFKEATLSSLCDYLTANNSIFSANFFAIECSEIASSLTEVNVLRKQLELFESMSIKKRVNNESM